MNSRSSKARTFRIPGSALGALAGLALASAPRAGPAPQDQTRILAWNDLGMHCMDPDFSVFSILPPYNTLNSQLIVNGHLLTAPGGYTVTYRAIADPSGSINRTSIGKTNFWEHVQELFGVNPPPDVGLAGFGMPGAANTLQWMGFDPDWGWYHAVGIPLTPIDDAQHKNPYGLMRVTARDPAGQLVATTITSVPVSQELTCSECHASFSNPLARPASGWADAADPLKDDRLNILRLHDERQAGDPTFASALAQAGYSPAGLLATVEVDGTAVMCDRCHLSNALGIGLPGVEPMTQAIHSRHAGVRNPAGQVLDGVGSRSACYSCHPGFETQCLRGAMGKAIDPAGDFAMQCQSCHENMSAVGTAGRAGWFDEPNCQSCHTGSATVNNGQIRYTSAYDAPGHLRVAVSNLFATTPDVPLPGSSLYRFSTGHGGLQCSACHGPPHAIYPTSVANDNRQNLDLQGHEGTLVDCTVCHASLEDNQVQGPHGMHPVSQKWVTDLHKDRAESNPAGCRACHGSDSRGTVLSRAQGARTFSTPFGTRTFWRGYQVGCYACHSGPSNDHANPNHPPVVADLARATPSDLPLAVGLGASDGDGDALTFRIVAQPAHGKVGLVGTQATYRAEPGFQGPDAFTFAAWDGDANSNLGTVQVAVGAPACSGSAETFGFGSVGSGGFLPRLSLVGCPAPGGQGDLVLENALGGSTAYLYVGTGRAQRELRPGTVVRLDHLLTRFPGLPVSGSGPGNGGFLFHFDLPPDFPPSTLVLQALVRDPQATFHLAFSNGLEMDIR